MSPGLGVDLGASPYASRRSPVMAMNGVVATSQPVAAQAGLAMLMRGGSAVDAAVAAAAALTVVEPTGNGIGGDALALVWDGERLHGLNGSGRAPAALDAERLRAAGLRHMPEHGWTSVTVPGAPAAWGDLHARFGRLPLAEVLGPAIACAEEGFAVTPIVASSWKRQAERILALRDPALDGFARAYTRGRRAPAAGERWRSPEQARTLRELAERGVRDFYEGAVAAALVAFARETGGPIAARDLAEHRSEWVAPISIACGEFRAWELPPNAQGIAALMALGMLGEDDLGACEPLASDVLHRQIECMKLAFADTYARVADPDHVAVPVGRLLDPAYLAARRALVSESALEPAPGMPPAGGTVYLCAADRDGMMVSFIQSNYDGFGSGIVVPGTGVSLHNRGRAFSLAPGHPNEAAGGKRPFHTIIPGFLTRGATAVGPFGVMGQTMQPQGHLQVLCATLAWGMGPQAALDMPRWRAMEGRRLHLEEEMPAGVAAALAGRGHDVRVLPALSGFGRGQIIWRLDDGVYAAGSDKRADGAAVGW